VIATRRSLCIARTVPQVYHRGVRVVLIALVMAGCGFQPGTAVNQAGDDGGPVIQDAASEGPTMTSDAKVLMDAAPCADDDQDGICNAQDDWPCGIKPTAPPTSYDLHVGTSGFKLTNISINQMGTLAVIGHGQGLRLQMHDDAKETGCGPGRCIDQLEVGWHPSGNRFACIFDQGVGSSTLSADIDATTDANDSQTPLTVPTTTGLYEIRASIGQRYGCYKATQNGPDNPSFGWWLATEPPVSAVIAKVCVD